MNKNLPVVLFYSFNRLKSPMVTLTTHTTKRGASRLGATGDFMSPLQALLARDVRGVVWLRIVLWRKVCCVYLAHGECRIVPVWAVRLGL